MTEKLKMEQNPLSATVEKIKEICPGAVTREGKIDFEELKTALRDDVTSDTIEKYEFTWVGKNTAKAEANRPIRKTLRPVIEDSKNWDTTQNLYIEGDNLDTLKLLQESYLGKVKMIYIDPPYNTGNDFVYCDEFSVGCEEYLDKKGQCDADGNRLFVNTETNGRFHSDWCSMIYSRLKIARDLLSDDGVIFISIDDHEVDNLKKICTEVFGYDNVETMVWHKIGDGDAGAGRMKIVNRFRTEHEYIVIAYKDKQNVFFNKLKEVPNFKNEYTNPDNDPRGPYKAGNMSKTEEKSSPNGKNYYSITSPDGANTYTRQWHYSKEEFEDLLKDNRIYWGKSGNAVPSIKIFVNEAREVVPVSLLENVGSATSANKYMETLFGVRIFNNPKPISLISKLLFEASNKDSVILDFFSGSATTAHAVMQLNAEDGGHRKFIMVQLPEKCEEDSEAFKAGYKNICEIGKERIRRAGEKIKSEHPDKDLDIGFRVLRVDSSNMKDVFYKPSDTTQKTLLDSIDNIKEDRSDMDLLFGVMVDCGLPLDMPIETRKCEGKKYYVVNGEDYLVACFEPEISEKLVYEIANLKPTIAVFRDSSFADAKDKVNVSEIFKNITGHDDCVKVL
ncbi:MAG: site-specific DNA-methyltransferase [Alphaproteobacteria bacterium]|nr:site-specific DNA-methyltransferase [Alphaproteobacteria bacterium]